MNENKMADFGGHFHGSVTGEIHYNNIIIKNKMPNL
jgi:hypothetical protein